MSLNRLNYNVQQDISYTKDKITEYQDHCKIMKNYVDFKMGNPYSEKDFEFETEPTPTNSKNREIKTNYFKGIRSKS